MNHKLDPPGQIAEILDITSNSLQNRKPWSKLLSTARYLGIVILAFANVRDLELASGLPLCTSIELLRKHVLAQELLEWNGKHSLCIPEDTWFQAIGLLIAGHKMDIDFDSTCLISDRGWSLYLSTFGDSDPTHIVPGSVVINRGVPCRNGVWKHRIIDGPKKGVESSSWIIKHTDGEDISLQNPSLIAYDRPLIGETHDSFIISLRMVTRLDGVLQLRRTGYRQLHGALWTTY